MFKKTYGDGSGVGINKGECISCDVTVGSLKTEDGDICAFVTEGRFTDEKLPKEFFGFGTVFEKQDAKNMFNYMALNGYRHHVAVSRGSCASAIAEAFGNYLGYKIDRI